MKKYILGLVLVLSTTAFASEHEVIKCTSIKNDVLTGKPSHSAFARVGKKYCEVVLDADGNAYGYWVMSSTNCENSTKNQDGNFTLLFKDALGDGAYLYHHYNLDKNFEGYIRLLSRAPKDVSKPITTKMDSVTQIVCSKVKMKFEE